MHILDIPFRLLPAPPAELPLPKNLPALPEGELESLCRPAHACVAQPSSAVAFPVEPAEPDGCKYEASSGRPCPRPVIHYADKEEPEEYCAAHLAWLQQVEDQFDIPYPDSPQALLDLLAHTTAQVLAHKMIHSQATMIMQLARAIERQLRWL